MSNRLFEHATIGFAYLRFFLKIYYMGEISQNLYGILGLLHKIE